MVRIEAHAGAVAFCRDTVDIAQVAERDGMNGTFDLDAYLRRIGYSGERAPTLAALAGIQLAHAQSISFENLDPLLGRPVLLDIDALQEKLVAGGRGGYCFEQNTLLAHALTALGFDVTGLAARVVMNQPPGAALPRTHMLLKVDVDGEAYIADVGFGGLTLTGPLRLSEEGVQETPHEPFRLAQDGDVRQLDALIGGTWTPLFRFDATAQIDADYEMMNYYTATHPDSVFRNNLTAARPVPGGRYTLRNNSLALHSRDGETDRRTLKHETEIRSVLADVFELALPDDPGLDAVLARFAAAGEP
jgi:N-hydroxyarylamine O-acetyltransferase